jgi:hypothetical protein
VDSRFQLDGESNGFHRVFFTSYYLFLLNKDFFSLVRLHDYDYDYDHNHDCYISSLESRIFF